MFGYSRRVENIFVNFFGKQIILVIWKYSPCAVADDVILLLSLNIIILLHISSQLLHSFVANMEILGGHKQNKSTLKVGKYIIIQNNNSTHLQTCVRHKTVQFIRRKSLCKGCFCLTIELVHILSVFRIWTFQNQSFSLVFMGMYTFA